MAKSTDRQIEHFHQEELSVGPLPLDQSSPLLEGYIEVSAGRPIAVEPHDEAGTTAAMDAVVIPDLTVEIDTDSIELYPIAELEAPSYPDKIRLQADPDHTSCSEEAHHLEFPHDHLARELECTAEFPLHLADVRESRARSQISEGYSSEHLHGHTTQDYGTRDTRRQRSGRGRQGKEAGTASSWDEGIYNPPGSNTILDTLITWLARLLKKLERLILGGKQQPPPLPPRVVLKAPHSKGGERIPSPFPCSGRRIATSPKDDSLDDEEDVEALLEIDGDSR